jgi:hypothetical protein
MSGDLVGSVDEILKHQHKMIEDVVFKECAMGLVHANSDSVAKRKGESKEDEMEDDQIDNMLEVADNKERNELQEERMAEFLDSRNSERESNQVVKKPCRRGIIGKASNMPNVS